MATIPDPSQCVIAEQIAITGDVTSQGRLQVRGRISGNVNSEDISVERSGEISGDVNARDVVVKGQVHGNITGARVSISAGGVVLGDITSEALAVEQGASFEGIAHPVPSEGRSAKEIESTIVSRAPRLPESD